MKALILNGAKTDNSAVEMVSDFLSDLLRTKHHDVEIVVLREENIAGCVGCFGC